jgi:hypothetical protein
MPVYRYRPDPEPQLPALNDRMPKLSPVLLITCTVATSFALATTTQEAAQLFDPTHGVILSGSEGKSVAEACGGASTTTGRALTPIDIGRLERQLAPLLAADLRNVGSSAVPRQYYRQYATGRLGQRPAIFVNGFYESYLLSAGDVTNWRRSAVAVSDGGDSLWCAVYIQETGEFVKFKGHHFDTHVWFHGLA